MAGKLRRIATARWLLVLAALPVGAEEWPSRFVDRVGTMTLSQELDARGALGGVTVDRLGFLYVANFRDAVWRISPDGEVKTLSRSLYGASGNAVDSRGDLYQANFLANTITRITRTGEVSRFASQGLEGPVGIAIDPQDRLYVCNCTGNSLSRVSPAGEVEAFARSELFACPNGITFGDGAELYVTNFNHHDLLRVTPEGEVSRFVTVPGGAGNAHIAFSKGFFYVTKIIAGRVVKVSASGEITPLAGSGQIGHQDGDASQATFQAPNGIAVSPQGDLLYLNSVVGEYNKQRPSTISVRTVELVTLTKVLEEARAAGGLEAMRETYRRYKADPVRGRENTVGEMITYGYSFLSNRQVAEALAIFDWNAASYPQVAVAQYQLGEAYRYSGRTEEAVGQYRKVLALEPDHANAGARLQQLGASD